MFDVKILLILLGVGMLGCTFNSDCLKLKSFDNCVSCKAASFSKDRDYNLKEVSNSIDSYLLTKGYLGKNDKSGYLKLFRDAKYLDIDIRDFIKDVDDTFLSSPILLGDYFECANNNTGKETKLISAIKKDTEFIFNDKGVRLESLTDLKSSEFNKLGNKLFFQILIYLDISNQK